MAKDTNIELYNSVIYSVYVRNHSSSGNFNGLINDLDRIAQMGIDTIWLMPIHPIGQYERKGSLGCPYSIQDYKNINPEYGTIDDFKRLLDETHNRSMKCIIDVVYNHTSKDSVLLKKNPEYFIRDKDGNITSKVEDWSDVADFDFSNLKLWDELIDILNYWCSIGVDGFRCDVAPLLPIAFWQRARDELRQKYPNIFFLAESCGLDFVEKLREIGQIVYTDSEIYTAFDIAYDYDMQDIYYRLIKEKNCYPKDFVTRLFIQNNIYPSNAIKLRFLENHDNPRAAKIIPDFYELKNYTALMFFQKGATLIYAGQETMETKLPSLFEIDTISLEIKNQEFYNLMKRLINLKKLDMFRNGFFYTVNCEDKNTVHLCYKSDSSYLHGIFNLKSKVRKICSNVTDGEYINLINNQKFVIKKGIIKRKDMPVYFESKQ